MRLSKSKIIAFRQCAKRLWLELHAPELRRDTPESLARMRQGNEVGALARALYDPEGIGSVLDPAQGLDRLFDETGALRKRYPAYREPATVWNSARVGTIELAVRPADLIRKGVLFDENFGAGSVNYLGDEYILVADANRAGLRCEYFPITIAVHPRESSGIGFGTAADARARSRVFDRVFGWLAAVPRALLWARNPFRFGTLGNGLRFVFGLFRD
jgi:hypothetical protein